jgi:hypothetical protein
VARTNDAAPARAGAAEEDTMPSLRLSTLVLAAALAGCSTVKVNTEYDPTAPFDRYKTYAWITTEPGPEEAPPIRNPQVRAQVVGAVDREMKAKGLVLTTPASNPDFLVSVHGWAQDKIEVANYGYAYGGAYRYGGYGVGYAVPVQEVRAYTQGTLLLDFVDAKSKQLVWRGVATDTISSPETLKKTINSVTAELLRAYPPPKQK